MTFKGLAVNKFTKFAAASTIAMSLAGCATRMTTDNGVVTQGVNFGMFGNTSHSHYDPAIGNAYEIDNLRKSANPAVARIGDTAACLAAQSKAPVTAQRLQEADRIDAARARALGTAQPATASAACQASQTTPNAAPRPAGM